MCNLFLFSRLKRYAFRCICRIIQAPRIFFYRLISSSILVGNPTLNQPLLIIGCGKIKIPAGVSIGYFPSPSFFSTYAHVEARNSEAVIAIGVGTFINNNFSAIAEHTSITIGSNVLIGTNVEIIDSDFHGINRSERKLSKQEWAKPVTIEDEVFIGNNVRILKGVTIGRGAVIANGAVVVSCIPADSIAGGNPARIIEMQMQK
jgi:acetyltransferase-like isoleucine patch superfamily enzyme